MKIARWARLATLVVPGKPPVKKNGQQIAKRRSTGRSFLLPNSEFLAWKSGAIWLFKAGWKAVGQTEAIGSELEAVRLEMRFFMPSDSHSDLSNLYEAVQDALQDAAVLSNDYWVVSHAGSERLVAEPGKERVEVSVYACVL
jgi:Holliday junction resolvase RusA-like endonuclease